MRRRRSTPTVSALVASLVLVACTPGAAGGAGDVGIGWDTPVFTEVSVHDPDLIRPDLVGVDGTW